jgi:hypothetical protein
VKPLRIISNAITPCNILNEVYVVELLDIENILSHYCINKYLSCEKYGADNNQPKYKIQTFTNEYFLKMSLRKYSNPIAINNRYYVMNKLTQSGIKVPVIIPTKENKNYILNNSYCIELFEWLDIQCYSTKTFKQFIEDISNIFLVYDKIEIPLYILPKTKKYFNNVIINECANPEMYNYKNISNYKLYVTASDILIIEEAINILKNNYFLLKDEISKLPLVYIHNDFAKSNIVYCKDKICVLDFDSTRLGFRIEDIAILFYDICIDINDDSKIIPNSIYYIEKMREIYPYINIDIMLFFTIKRLINIISSQLEEFNLNRKPLLLQGYLNGIRTIVEKII